MGKFRTKGLDNNRALPRCIEEMESSRSRGGGSVDESSTRIGFVRSLLVVISQYEGGIRGDGMFVIVLSSWRDEDSIIGESIREDTWEKRIGNSSF